MAISKAKVEFGARNPLNIYRGFVLGGACNDIDIYFIKFFAKKISLYQENVSGQIWRKL